MTKTFFTIATFFAFAITAQAATQPKFINVDLTTTEANAETPTQVKMRIPMGLVHAMAPQLEEAFNQANVQGEINLREMWSQIEGAGPMRFAEIQSADATVTVDTTETHLQVAVDATNEGRINISVPLALGNALFGEEATNFDQFIQALQNVEGDLLTIDGDKVSGRIWVD